MNQLLNEINEICPELRSDKVNTRNKAVGRLDQLLTNSKTELITLFENGSSKHGLGWKDLFDSSILAILKHAFKIDEQQNNNTVQALRNKNYVYSGVVNKLIDINIEYDCRLLTKTQIFNAFTEGFKARSAVVHFNELFLEILDRGLLKSPKIVRQLKVSDYSLIVSHLFELNVENNDRMLFSLLRNIIKTIELASQHVQLHVDFIDYLTDLKVFAEKAKDERNRADVLKIITLFINQLATDYHHSVCLELLNLLPIICHYFEVRLKTETKELFFNVVYLSLRVIYSHIDSGDYNTLNITLTSEWTQCLRKLRTIVDMEVRERKMLSNRLTANNSSDSCFQSFIKMSALVTQLFYWHLQTPTTNEEDADNETRKKIPKPADQMDIIINLVQTYEANSTNYNDTWFAILSQLLENKENILLNASNHHAVLKLTWQFLQKPNNGNNIRYIRLVLQALLNNGQYLKSQKSIQQNYGEDLWTKITEFLINDETLIENQTIQEKELLIQQLILARKLTATHCEQLLQNYIKKPGMRRNSCMETVRLMLLHAEQCGINKSSDVTIGHIITWAYDSKVNIRNMMANVGTIKQELVADTCAIAVINFLQGLPSQLEQKTGSSTLPLLLYKHNRRLVCLEEHAQQLQQLQTSNVANGAHEKLNCFFQCNYELLMRHLQFETSRDTSCRDILNDLASLHKMVCLMHAFLKYDVFTDSDYAQCPLIKRIGFFLSHLELQLKSNEPKTLTRANLTAILTALEAIFAVFTDHPILLSYLEREPLEELLVFVGTALKSKILQVEELPDCLALCLKIMSLLCASSSHTQEAAGYILACDIDFVTEHNNILLSMIEIFCKQKLVNATIADWFVEELKFVFKHHYNNIEIITKIVHLLPAMFKYVQEFEDAVHTLLVAISSLMTLGINQSYTVQLTASLLQSLREIVQQCSDVCKNTDFQNICYSAAKFLAQPALQVQFAAVNTIAAFVDINWLKSNENLLTCGWYYEFCQQLIKYIDWKKLPVDTTDMLQNANAVAFQTLTALFCFSSYHQEYALNELCNLCDLRKLTASNLQALENISDHFQRPLSLLTETYMSSLIHNWTEKKCRILKFPYFLSHNTLEQFVRHNLSTIVTCLCIYAKESFAHDIEALQKIVSKQLIVESILPLAQALSFPHQSSCIETKQERFNINIANMLQNCKILEVNVLSKKDINWQTLLNLLHLVHDEEHFEQKFSLKAQAQQARWFNVSHESLLKCLQFYLRSKNINSVFTQIVAKQPLTLIHTLGALKAAITNSFFLTEQLRHFYLYCCISELIIDSLQNKEKHAAFFARDILFFTLQFYKNAQHDVLRQVAVKFLHILFVKSQVLGSDSVLPEYENICQQLRCAFAEQNYKHVNETIEILHESQSQSFHHLSENSELSGSNEQGLNAFLASIPSIKTTGIEGLKTLRQQLPLFKQQLQQQGTLSVSLLTSLIDIARNQQSTERSYEALLCLGEIGALKLNGISYYLLLNDDVLYEARQNTPPMLFFTRRILHAMQKCLLTFNPESYNAAIKVAEEVTNCTYATELQGDFPYLSVFHTSTTGQNYLNNYASLPNIEWLNILKNSEQESSYEEWICKFMSKVFGSCHWQAFEELASKDSHFADAALEPFIELLMENITNHLENLGEMLASYFEQMEQTLNNIDLEGKRIYRDKLVANKFLNICECIRLNNEWKVPVNLLHLSKASNYCQAYFMSIMYLELWALQQKEDKQAKHSIAEILSNETFQKCATHAYRSIKCDDAIAGFINPLDSRLDLLNLNNDWSDMLLEANTPSLMSEQVYTDILKRNGMYGLAGLNPSAKEDKIHYDICWRLGQWKTPVEGHAKVNIANDLEQEFEKHHFNALKCLVHHEENNTIAAIANARQSVLLTLQQISVECLQTVYKLLTWLQLLQQTEDFCKLEFRTSTAIDDTFEKWQRDEDLEYASFHYKEQVLAHQIALFKTAGIRANRKIENFYKDNPIESCLLKCIKECKRAGETNLAIGYLSTLRNMEISNDANRLNLLLEDAEICMKTGKTEITKAILQHVFTNKAYTSCLQRVRAYRMQGELLMETNSDTFSKVLEKQFNGSLKLLQKFANLQTELLQMNPHIFEPQSFEEFECKNKQSAYEIIAKYADREYTQLNTYTNSEEYQMKCQLIKQQRKTADSVKKTDRDRVVGAMQLKKFANLDEEEIKNIETSRTDNLCIAMEHYIQYCQLKAGNTNPEIYRIIALWFANKNNAALHEKICEKILNIPSYKFICALNQITARLNSNNQQFVDILKKLLMLCVQDHPHHTLYQLMPLVYAFADAGTVSEGPHNRVNIAKQIIAKARNKNNANCIRQMEQMIPALIEFANAEVTKSTYFPLSEKLKNLKNLDAIQVPTIELPVSASKEYQITSIIKWEDKATLVGGINVPRKINCLCSNGKKYSQLLKGKDDLRQDAVMQQLFSMINDLLSHNPETRARKLALRTYKIVPLSMRSGILEWCENTVPLGQYLAGDKDNGAHKRYHPNEYTVSKCRNLSMQHIKSERDKRLAIYMHICGNFTPVFQHFFFERFRAPGVWFEKRLAYINSVATTSMVGFILGLGDRHSRNILIDEFTGEVVHIDFGIAFEQGKIMPTPETVPFRLTRDMVAPMGICGTNGTFKKSCEATMQVLRRNHAIITTILEVLLYDPLYIWKVVLQQSQTAASGSDVDEEKNLMAQRALLCVQNKLEGKQNGTIGVSSVDVQVQRLINEAMLPSNLCMHFPGWDPYC